MLTPILYKMQTLQTFYMLILLSADASLQTVVLT